MPGKKSYEVKINRTLCKKCGLCYWICPTKTIVAGEFARPEIPDQSKCIGCLQCERICPDFAINVLEQEGEQNG
ncbi:MAG: 4Fe-4S binding protein [Thermotogae bacterium]|nr:4Fe-4S binding protein [Thermotogota bacterium]HOO74893.1 4Fe-4S binding protein [Tepiditoga sp.]